MGSKKPLGVYQSGKLKEITIRKGVPIESKTPQAGFINLT